MAEQLRFFTLWVILFYKKFRKLRGLTQKALGKKANLDDVRIRQYELDIRSPKDDMLEDISNALNVKSEYFKEVIRLI